MGLLNLRLGEIGIALEQERPDGLFPGKVDELLVCLDGVGASKYGKGEQEECERESSGAEMSAMRSTRGHEVRITAGGAGAGAARS